MRPYIQTYEDAVEVLQDYKRLKPDLVSVDTETRGLNWPKDDVFLVQVGWGNAANYAFPKKYLHLVRPILEDAHSAKVFHNAKFDMHFLDRAGVRVAGNIHDTHVMARLLLKKSDSLKLADLSVSLIDPQAKEPEIVLKAWMNREKRRRSKELTKALREIGITRKHYDAWKEGKEQIAEKDQENIKQVERSYPLVVTYEDVPVEIMEPYAIGDIKCTFSLYHYFYPKLEYFGLLPVYERDMQTLLHVYEWEKTGLAVDEEYIHQAVETGTAQLKDLEKEIHRQAGTEININSPKQLLELFHGRGFDQLESTDVDALESIANQDPLADKILEYRKIDKIVGTYFKPFTEKVVRGRIHGSFNVAGAVTGRFSSSSPNLQNIPRSETPGLSVRKAVVPSIGYTLVFMDYEQMEVCLMAEYSHDENLVHTIINKEDLHTKTTLSIAEEAEEVYRRKQMGDEEAAKTWKKLRTDAKRTTFGIFYGIGRNKLAKQIHVTPDKAAEYINNFFRTYPGVYNFIQFVQRVAAGRQGHWVRNKFGRIYWGDPHKLYGLVDYLIQGSCADILKIGIDRCEKILDGKRSRIVSSVHDELIFEIHNSELDLVPLLKEQLEYWPELEMPLTVEVSYSDTSWADKKEWAEDIAYSIA